MADKISLDRVDEMLRAVFNQLKSMNGRARGSEVLAAVAPKLNLSAYEKERTKTGAVRWDTHVRFYTTDCVKAGFLQKSDGVWILTQAGETALSLKPGELIRTAAKQYRAWRRSQTEETKESENKVAVEEVVERQAAYDQAKEIARTEIDDRIDELGPYDFQKLVQELLRGMGYHVPFNAPPGPDGGVDLIAYKDPLGTTTPRIKVQVKHRESKVGAKEVRELEGVLRKDGDMGMIVSSEGFSSEAIREIRSSTKHIETMDQDRLVALWQEHYERISQTGKSLLPLVKVFFLAPEQE